MGHFLGSSVCDNRAPFVGGAGAKIDDEVSSQHHLGIVFNYNERVSHIYQRVETIQQLDDIGEVQTCGRFVHQEERSATPG